MLSVSGGQLAKGLYLTTGLKGGKQHSSLHVQILQWGHSSFLIWHVFVSGFDPPSANDAEKERPKNTNRPPIRSTVVRSNMGMIRVIGLFRFAHNDGSG